MDPSGRQDGGTGEGSEPPETGTVVGPNTTGDRGERDLRTRKQGDIEGTLERLQSVHCRRMGPVLRYTCYEKRRR